MSNKKILVVSCSQKSAAEKQDLKIYDSLRLLKNDIKLKIHFNNKTPLPKIYNQYLTKETLAKHDIVVFAHDDVYVDDLKVKGKLDLAANGLDIIGVAGCLNPKLQKPALWHLMSDQKDWRGHVAHTVDERGVIQMTSFGPTPSRVAIVDGVFIAVNLKSILDVDWRFNEKFEFHHYDISSCIDANKLKLKVGVIPVNIIHDSPGLKDYNNTNYQESQNKFLQLYSK
jgi:hypothetical protein